MIPLLIILYICSAAIVCRAADEEDSIIFYIAAFLPIVNASLFLAGVICTILEVLVQRRINLSTSELRRMAIVMALILSVIHYLAFT